ncbi:PENTATRICOPEPTIDE REPEAT-CONTAINING PROTEIN [Salix purpurea]|uniref:PENTATRICOPEPTIDE REPEAT-CONTAINING PROTEIN n=1 Tax=Salix purpurea TaxID=77065 RepID=A0A9Q0ZHM1_SALPP|nr:PENTATRICOPEPTIDE REPEAT-CONTAINING PROTEIN [Salix purpurea]
MKCSTINFTTLQSLPAHFRSLLRSCARNSSLSTGKKLHAVILTSGLASSSPNSFLLNALHHLYASCGVASSARHLFYQIPRSHKDVTDWTTLLSCLAQHRTKPSEGFCFFKEMRKEGVVLDDVAMISVFVLCTRVEDLGMGRQAQGCLVKMGLGFGVKVCNAVMNMYVKCGLVEEVRRVFCEMNERNVVSWSTLLEGVVKWEGVENGRVVFDEMPERNGVGWTIMIAGYVGNGFSRKGFILLDEMVSRFRLGLNFVTLSSILSACAQSGDVLMGRWVHVYALKGMGREMHIMIEHYACMVDLLGRAGHLEEALMLIKKMPMYPNEVVLGSLLGSCNAHGKLQLGERILQELIEMDQHNTEYHVLLSNMYALEGKQEKANSLRQILKSRGIRKVPGVTSIYVGGEVEELVEAVCKADDELKRKRRSFFHNATHLDSLTAFSFTLFSEWGDESQISTIGY